MNIQSRQKLTLLYFPFLLIASALAIVYTFIHWLLFIKLELFPVKEMVINFGVPALVAGIVIFFYFRPRLRHLDLESKKGDWVAFYCIVLWIALAVPTMIAQSYLIKASGKMTSLQSMSQIAQHPKTKYYVVEDCFIDKQNIGVQSKFDVSGKYNRDFNMNLYVVVPLQSYESDTIKPICDGWLGIKYNKRINNSLSQAEKEQAFEEFAAESKADFESKDLTTFQYLDRVGNSEGGDVFNNAILASPKYRSGNAAVFYGIAAPFEKRLGNTFAWIFISLGIGFIIWMPMVMIPNYKDSGATTTRNKSESEWQSLLIPKEGYFITPILIYLNVGIFLLMMFNGLGFVSFSGRDLLAWGANLGPLTRAGQWWRLLTSTFLHGGMMHLLANMYGLLFVGIFLEPLLGRWKFLTAYLLTGILASCASIWWYDATLSVGASGAIFGLYGIFLALLITKVYEPHFAKAFLISTSIFVGFNLLMGLTGGIDNAAHIGGLVVGFFLGLLLRLTLKREEEVITEYL